MARLRAQFDNNKMHGHSTAAINSYFNTRLGKLKVKYGLRFKKGGVLMAQDGLKFSDKVA